MDYFAEPGPLQQHMPIRTPPTIPQHSITNYNQQQLSSSSSAPFNATNDLMLLGEPSSTPTNVYTPPHTAFTPPPPPADPVADQPVPSERPLYQHTAHAYPGYPSSLSVQKQDNSLSTLSPQQPQHTQVQTQAAAPQPPPQQSQPQHVPMQIQAPVPAYQPPQLSSSSRPQAVNGMLVPSIAPTPTVASSFQTSAAPSMKPDRVVQLLEQMQSNFDNIVQRLDGIENRMTSLELVTKEILGNQRIHSQQRKLQEPVDPPRVAFPPQMQPLYEAPRDDYLKKPAVYSPPPMPTPTISSSTHQMYPSVSSPAPPQMTFVQATQVKSPVAYDADLELAKKLQASFDQETSKPEVKKPAPAPALEVKTSECPMCQMKVSVADLEAHVESHFDDPVKKPVSKDAPKDSPKPGFLNKLFGSKDEKDAKPDTVSKETPHPPANAYPRMVPASSFYGPGGYHYPNGYPAQMARPGTGRPGQQPYLYYPAAEQHQ